MEGKWNKFTWFPKLTGTVAKVPEELRGSLLWALSGMGPTARSPIWGGRSMPSSRAFARTSPIRSSAGATEKAGVEVTERRLRVKRNHPLAKPKPPFAKSQTPLWVMSKPPFARAERGLWKMPNPNQTKPVQSNPNQRW